MQDTMDSVAINSSGRKYQTSRRTSLHKQMFVDNLASSFGNMSIENFNFPLSQQNKNRKGSFDFGQEGRGRTFSKIIQELGNESFVDASHSLKCEGNEMLPVAPSSIQSSSSVTLQTFEIDGNIERDGNHVHDFSVGPQSQESDYGRVFPEHYENDLRTRKEEEEKNHSFLLDSPVFLKESLPGSLMSLNLSSSFNFGTESLQLPKPVEASEFKFELKSEFELPSGLQGMFDDEPRYVTGGETQFAFPSTSANDLFDDVPQEPEEETTTENLFSSRFGIKEEEQEHPHDTRLKSNKRTKDEAKYETRNKTISLSRAQQKLNACKTISMAASLEHAPVLKLRKRAVSKPTKSSNLYSLRRSISENSIEDAVKGMGGLFLRSDSIKSSKNDEEFNQAPKPGYVGIYTQDRRRALLQKFLEKRKQRVWGKRIRYSVRKSFADSRLRVKGRFVGKEDEGALREGLMLLM